MRLMVETYLLLTWTGIAMRRHSLKELLERAAAPPRDVPQDEATGLVARIVGSVDLACVFYPRRIFCLERSLATALLLRRHGIPAELVLGARMLPFKSHAWVEVEGVPVNDKPYMREIYGVFDSGRACQ